MRQTAGELQLARWFFAALLGIGCSDVEPTGGRRAGGDASPAELTPETTQAATASRKASYDAFEKSLFPLLVDNCGSCHGSSVSPKFAVEADPAKSHDELLAAKKVNLDNPGLSRIVARVRDENHNCWSDCKADGETMLTAIKEWQGALAAQATTTSTTQYGTIQTSTLKLSTIQSAKVGSAGDLGLVAFEAESVKPTAPLLISGNTDASGSQVITSEAGGVPAGEQAAAHSNNNSLGSVTYAISLAESGFYKINGRVSTPAAGNNEFFVTLDDAPMKTWDINGGQLHWEELQFNEDTTPAQYFELQRGEHTLTIKQAQLGVAIDKIIVSKSLIPDLDSVQVNPMNFPSLVFDLSSVLNRDVKFAINLIKGTGNAYVAQNPTIINNSGQGVKIRGIYPLADGVFTEQNSTFTTVDKVVGEGVQVLSDSSSVFLLGPADGSTDPDISISFKVLELTDLPAGSSP